MFESSTTTVNLIGEFHLPEADSNGEKEEEGREEDAEEDEKVDVHS